MGLLDFFKRKKEPEFDYTEIIEKSWDIFRQGLKNPNEKSRRSVEEAVWNIESPEGKRYFAVGMQEPNLQNKVFVLKKLYERGGWRLAENLLKIAFNEFDELTIDERTNIIYFLGEFSDPSMSDYLETGLESNEVEIRIATLCAYSGIKSSEKSNLLLKHLEQIQNDLEKFVCSMALHQYNKTEGKKLFEEYMNNNPSIEYIKKLKYIEFNKIKSHIEKLSENNNSEIKKVIIELIQDNRGINIIKKLLKDNDSEVANKAIEQVIKNGSRSALPEINEIVKNPELEKNSKLALAVFGDKEAQKELEERSEKGSLEQETFEDLKIMGMIEEKNVSKILDKLLEPITDLNLSNLEELEKVNQAIKILIKYGKMSSILVVSRYCDLSFLESEDNLRWEISCNSAAAILCIVERNTSYYTLAEKKIIKKLMHLLDKDIQNIEFVAFDLETTGLFPATFKIIEIGAIKFNLNGEISRFEKLIDPKSPIPMDSYLIHGINDEMVIGKPTIDQVLPEFLNFIENSILIAHHSIFDVSFISYNLLNNKISYPDNLVLDTRVLAKNVIKDIYNFRLSTLVDYYGIESNIFHRAINDAYYCKEVFLKLLHKVSQIEEQLSFDILTKYNKPMSFKIMSKENVIVNLPEIYSPIEEAMKHKRKVKISYKRYNGDISDRDITPLNFIKMKNKLYLEAFCHLRDEKRTFKLSKIITINK